MRGNLHVAYHTFTFIPEFMFSEWKTRRRDERDSEFAPPTDYFTVEKWQKPAKTKPPVNKWTKEPSRPSEEVKTQSQAPTAACPPQPQQFPAPPEPNPPSQAQTAASPPEQLPTPPEPNLSAPPDRPSESAPVSAPPFNMPYPPPPFYPLFCPPPPYFARPPHMHPPFPQQYPNQYPHPFPPQKPVTYPPQQPPQPVEENQSKLPAQSLDDMLSFYRNST